MFTLKRVAANPKSFVIVYGAPYKLVLPRIKFMNTDIEIKKIII